MNLSSLPSFRKLLEEGLVIVLGAGASKEYGFPLWAELKPAMEECFSEKHHHLNIGNDDANYWLKKLSEVSKNTNQSVDNIAGRSSESQYTAFQKTISYILLEKENEDLQKIDRDGWIETVAETYASILEGIFVMERDYELYDKLAENLTIVSLNYDRLFQKRFYDALNNRFLNQSVYRIANRIGPRPLKQVAVKIFQPHGAIAMLEKSTLQFAASNYGNPLRSVPYGGLEHYMTHFMPRTDLGSNVVCADDTIYGKGSTYSKIDKILQTTPNVISIGLSDVGFNQSQFNFSHCKRLILTNKLKEFDAMDSERLPLGDAYFEDRGAYASKLIKRICSKPLV